MIEEEIFALLAIFEMDISERPFSLRSSIVA
jgi:hypothetical protein